MEKDFYQISLKLILKNSRDEILVLKALDTGTYAGFYDLPGGRINKDEFNLPFEKILRREIKEEIGKVSFKLTSIQPAALGRHKIEGRGNEIHILYLFFEGRYIKGNIKISEEHSSYDWLDLEKINLKKYFKSGILEGVEMHLWN
ncbi:hypothetical protein A2Y83_01700 [Candidatus Falkowbacteria bacterium RBG_13_39_14]|uniref:Nudix hydrolase domain-containing protein n=1 Tax=Candidatus Falkowbacteria bacterium RBG_13_39_14 TaxID=1797985 RepID=A0A1F5S2K5_9BACT|nr:MAG: hypothetical protein A2Y83_01700 [Candidatus Falkowbacteria bacterium RBG_13_39_14]